MNLVTQPCPKKSGPNKKFKPNNHNGPKKEHDQTHKVLSPKVIIKKDNKCWFCQKEGHKRSDCPGFKIWLAKHKKQKGNLLALVCFESDLMDVPLNS